MIVATDIAFVFFIINGIGSLILLLGLGVWLIRNQQLSPPAMAMTPAAP